MTDGDALSWLNGWPRMGVDAVMVGGVIHCVGCGTTQGVVCFIPDTESEPRDLPAWPFEAGYCPVCDNDDRGRPVFDVRVSELRRDQLWLLDGGWVRVVGVTVGHPDDRVAVTYELDGEQYTTREYRGSERAAVR